MTFLHPVNLIVLQPEAIDIEIDSALVLGKVQTRKFCAREEK